jgi:DNA-binding response OmpR family regulator
MMYATRCSHAQPRIPPYRELLPRLRKLMRTQSRVLQGCRILIVDGAAYDSAGLAMTLRSEGYVVETEADGNMAIARTAENVCDLIIFDLNVPSMAGFDLIRELRAQNQTNALLVLTDLSAETDRVTAFRLGVDDYVVKPYSLLEVLERIRRLLFRCSRRSGRDGRVTIGTTEVELENRIARREGVTVRLSPKECDLLAALVAAEGAAVSKELLLARVWGHKARVRTNTVEYHIAALRKKVEADPGHPKYILTVSKTGYRLVGPLE